MRRISLIIFLLLTSLTAFSAAPDWEVNVNDFQFSMTISGVVVLDGIETTDPSDRIAAWNGTELRGTAQPFYVANTGRYYFFLTMYSNGGTENISFQFYDASEDAIIDLNNRELFISDKQMGSFSTPYIFANEHAFTQFAFKNITSTTSINKVDREILVSVPSGTDVTQLIAEYQFAGASSVKIGTTTQTSGTTVNNFTNVVTYTVVTTSSETQTWTVTVTIVASISEVQNTISISVFPNPSQDIINISSDEMLLSVEVYNINGSVIFKSNETRVYCGEWPSGKYSLVMNFRNGVVVKEVIKE